MIGLGQRAAASDPGKRRRRNEDAYVVEPPLFAVADGMGGAQAGEIAREIAASVLRESSGEQAVVELIKEANRRVYEAAAGDDTRSGMGTTDHRGDRRGRLGADRARRRLAAPTASATASSSR
jgi:protein phosphatase